MRVIKAGKVTTKEIVCENCGTVMEITKEDLHRKEDHTGWGFVYVTCPICNKHVEVIDRKW